MALPTTTPIEENSELAAVLGKVPSGLFIVTATSGTGQSTGLLASWVQQASFEPPIVTVAVNNKRYLNAWLVAAPAVGLSLIGDGQKEFLKHFGAGFDIGQPAFEGLSVLQGRTGVPLLADALGFLEGHVVGSMEAGDHTIYAVSISHAGRGPNFSSLSPWVHLRKNGLKY